MKTVYNVTGVWSLGGAYTGSGAEKNFRHPKKSRTIFKGGKATTLQVRNVEIYMSYIDYSTG